MLSVCMYEAEMHVCVCDGDGCVFPRSPLTPQCPTVVASSRCGISGVAHAEVLFVLLAEGYVA